MRGRKVFLTLAILCLAGWGLAALMMGDTLLYALSDPTPVSIDEVTSLAPYSGRFVSVHGTPDLDRSVVYHQYGIPNYWYLLSDHGSILLVGADAPLPRAQESPPQVFRGRLQRLGQVAFSSQVADRFQQTHGLSVTPDTYAILDSHSPGAFLPMAAMFLPVTALWLAVLIAAVIVGRSLLRHRVASKGSA